MTEQSEQYFRKIKPVMACGHIANAIKSDEYGERIPVCSNCIKTNPSGAKEVADIKGRVAQCSYCGTLAPSSPDLFGFLYTGKEYDTYYDGCKG